MEASTLVDRVIESQKRIRALETEGENILNQAKDRRWKIEKGYREKIDALKSQQDEALALFDQQARKEYERPQAEITAYRQVITEAKRALDFLRLKADADLAIGDDDVQVPQGVYKEALGYVVSEQWLRIKLFLLGNNKPKQKFSLCALGRTIFPELKLPNNSGCPFWTSGKYSLEAVIRTFPSLEEAKKYLAHGPLFEALIAKLKGDYDQTAAEYMATLRDFKPENFAPLMTAVCKGCQYFLTVLDEPCKSGDKCVRCSQPMTMLK